MSRIRIETVSRRTNDLPRDPSDWVDKDLLSYVRYNYSPIEAVSLSEVIERDRLTPTALWYLQAEPEQLLAIAEEESLRDTLLGLALSLKPAVSPTSPRIRHVRRLSEDLERPPPPPPPPPPSPPTPEEPELEEDDDVAESIVSDWALDEDLDGDDGTTPTMDALGDPAEFAAQPEPPLEGLGLHTGEPHLDNLPTPQPQPMSMDTDDLINLEDEAQPTLPQEEATEPHATRTDTDATDDPLVPTSSQGTSTDAHVPDAAEEKPPAATHRADPSPPSDGPSASREAGASMPADPFAGSNTFGSPIDDDDLGNPWADSEDTSGPDPSSTPLPAADPARTATPTSDYHDANSTHSGEGERPEATPAEQEPDPSPVHPQEQESPTTSGDEDQSSTETPLPIKTPVQGVSGDNASSGDAAPAREEVQPENPAPVSSEDPIEPPPPATEPVHTAPPATDPVQVPPPATDSAEPSPSVTDPAQPLPSVTEPVSTPAEETAQTLKEDVSPTADPDRDKTTHVGPDETKDAQAEEPSVQSTTTTSGIPSSEQSQEIAEAEDRESAHLGGEESADKVGDEAVEQVGEDVVDKVGVGEEEAIPATTTTKPSEMTAPPEVTTNTVNNSPAPEGSSDDASGVQAEEQTSSPETQAVPAEAEANPSSITQDEGTLEKSSTPSDPPAAESTPSPLLSTDITTPTATVFDPPPSPTVILASGIEAQLIDRDPESTEQTPSASPGDTPPNESSSPSGSRQASPPADAEAPAETEAEAEKPPSILRDRIPSSSSLSPVTPAEGKRPAPSRLNTAFGSSSEPLSSAKPSTHQGSDHSAWQGTSTFRSALSPAAKDIAWGSARFPPPKSAGSWGRGLFSTVTSSVTSSMTSLFNPQSEPSTRDSSPERESSSLRTPASSAPARQASSARQNPWDKNRNRSTLASASRSTQQASKPKEPPAPAAETSVNVSPLAQVSPPAGTDHDTKTSSDPSPLEGPTIQETNSRTEEPTDAMVLVDSGTPSAGNGEPVRDVESSQAPTIQPVASAKGDSPDADCAGGKDGRGDAEDEDMVKIIADDITGADQEEGCQSRPRGDVDPDEDEDEDENAPLNLRLARVRQMTGDSVSSAVTSDTETQGDEERPGPRTAPKLQTSGLASEPDGVGSPAVESPIVGTPTQSKAKKRKNKKKRGTGGS